MNMYLRVLLSLTVLLSVTCTQEKIEQAILEDYAVYDTILDYENFGHTALRDYKLEFGLDSLFVAEFWPGDTISYAVIENRTIPGFGLHGLMEQASEEMRNDIYPGLAAWIDWNGLYEGLKIANTDTTEIRQAEFRNARRISVVSSDSLAKISKGNRGDGFWNAYYRHFPGTGFLYEFSRVGYNGDKTQAIVSCRRYTGGLGGFGSNVILRKNTNGNWYVAGDILAYAE